ncbi:MAG: glycosyl hydrolase family protein [Acholeplasmatales bacterium]|nr:MAG: glycosyl hydrolase family protein [Acholeplasmatales bacterium]
MKRCILTTLFALLAFLIVACDKGDNGAIPRDYDPRGLVDARCTHLENLDEHWQPVWCDEFDVDGLPDPTRWGYDVGGGGWGNRELQYYTRANLNNAFVEDGRLHIRAIRESFMGNDYTSARLVSKYYGDWLYGRIQVSARMPSGTGTWPAIWMLPTNRVYGNWPNSGEIDIMEYVGYDPGVVHGTIHTGAFNHMQNTQIGFRRTVPTAETAFHVYEMIWEPARIRLFIDGDLFATFGFNPLMHPERNTSDLWPFDQPFHLILNLAVGGDWGGQRGVDPDAFPTTLEIEYVRVYQKDYAGLDREAPSAPTQLIEQSVGHDRARLRWTHATDDVMVRHYNLYVDGTLVDTTTVNAHLFTGLTPGSTYVLEVEAEDFAGNTSSRVALPVDTAPVRLATERIRAAVHDGFSGVSFEATDDEGGGVHVSGFDEDDWIDYWLEVPESGQYRVHYRVASAVDGGQVAINVMPQWLPRFTVDVPNTGSGQQFTTVTSDPMQLSAGVHRIRIRALSGGFNLNWFEFERMVE